MKVSTEKATIEAAGELEMLAGSVLDATLATAGFFPPQIAGASLPAAAGVEGMIAYNATTNKLNFSNGVAWEVVTSA